MNKERRRQRIESDAEFNVYTEDGVLIIDKGKLTKKGELIPNYEPKKKEETD